MKIHEYNEMMAYLTRPASRQPVVQGGVIGEGGMFQGEDMGYRTGFKKLKTPSDYKYSGVFKMKTGENKGKYTFEIRNPDYTGKGSNKPTTIKIGPFDNETDAIKAYQERQPIAKKLRLATLQGAETKIIEQTKAINNFVTDFYEKNLNNFELRDYESFEKKLIEEFKKSGIEDLGSGRKTLNFGFPNIGKKAKKKSSKFPLTLYGMDARTPGGLNLQTAAQSFFKKAFYSGKLKNNPELVEKLRRYLEYYNTDKKFYKGRYIDRVALEAKYADVLNPKVKSDLIYFLESDQIGTGKLRSSIIKEYLPDEYKKYLNKKNASNIRYQALMKNIEDSLTEKQLKQALNEETSIKKFMRNQTNLLNKIFDTSELKKAGYPELIFNADHLEGIAEIAQMDNPDDKIRALRNLIGTTSEINKELGLEGFSSKRKSLMQKITNGTNVEANINELNKITKEAYPQFEGDLYKYNPATKTAIPTKNFIFNYDPETAFRQYFNELVKNPVGSKILTKQYLDKPELQKVVQKDPNLLSKMNAELRTLLLNSADTATIMRIRKVLDCPTPKSSGGRIGFAPGGNLLDCPMKKLAENPEAVLNKVGQEIPETRSPITNMFKKLGTPLKWAGNTFNVALGPTGVVGLNYFLGVDPTRTADRIGLEAELAFAKPLVEGAKSVTDKIKTPFLRKAAETAAGIRIPGIMTPANALKIAGYASRVGTGLGAAEALYQVGKLGYEDQKRFDALSLEEQAAERAEQEEFAQSVQGAAEGGRVGFGGGGKLGLGKFIFTTIRDLYKGKKGLQEGAIRRKLAKEYKEKGVPFDEYLRKVYDEAEAIVDDRKLDIVQDAMTKVDIRSDDYIKLMDEQIKLTDYELYKDIKRWDEYRPDLSAKVRARHDPYWAESNFGENYDEVLLSNQARALKAQSDEIDRMYPADDPDVGPSFVGEQQMVDEIDEMNKANIAELLEGKKKHAVGGRVGLKEGSPKSPSRRAFLKGITALAALPVVGKFFKLGKVLEAGKYTGPTIEKIKGMPEWFPSLVKKLYTEGTDVTKEMAYKERQIVKRGTLESGDDVDMIYDLDTGNVSIEVRSKGGETSSGSYNQEYGLDYKKGEVIDDVDVPQTGTIDPKTGYTKKLPDEFVVNETEMSRSGPEMDDVDYYGNETSVDGAISDLTELEAFAKNKTVKQIHKKKGTKPKDLRPSELEVDWDDVANPYD